MRDRIEASIEYIREHLTAAQRAHDSREARFWREQLTVMRLALKMLDDDSNRAEKE